MVLWYTLGMDNANPVAGLCRLSLLLSKLTGIPAPFDTAHGALRGEETLKASGMGYTQLNEVLLCLGYPRVSEWFFQYLLDGTTDYEANNAFKSLIDLENGIDRFRQHAMLRQGNVRYAFDYFRTLSQAEL